MNDSRTKGHFKGLDIAFTHAVTTTAINQIIIGHDCDPVATHLLGRALTGALLSAAILPEGHRINVCWKYQGALRTIVVDAGQDGTVRGFISPTQIGQAEDLTALYGDLGDLQMVVSHKGKIISSSTTPISLQDVTNDLAYAHCISDQVETCISAQIGFNADPENPVQISRGWMLQALPNCDLERFDRIRQKMDQPAFRKELGSESTIEALAHGLVEDESDFKGLHHDPCAPPQFFCSCTREKMSSVVRTLPYSERMEWVKKKENIKIRCQFCNTLYELTLEECIKAWNEKEPTETSEDH